MVPVTVGGVVSTAAAVVNVQVDVGREAVAGEVGDPARAAQDAGEVGPAGDRARRSGVNVAVRLVLS